MAVVSSVSFDGPYGYDLTYRYDSKNLLRSVVSTSDTNALSRSFPAAGANKGYDGNGNVLYNGSQSFSYDAANQLLTASADEDIKTLRNTYDANHHRSKAVVTTKDRTRTTYSLYSAGNLLFELDAETGEQRSHIFLAGQSIATLGTHHNVDTDSDGIPDYYERLHGLDAHDARDRDKDEDGDGISNLEEYTLGGMAMSTDGDNDGMPDSWEHKFNLAIGVTNGVSEDADNDGVSNYQEYQNGTDPTDRTISPTESVYLVPVIHQLFF